MDYIQIRWFSGGLDRRGLGMVVAEPDPRCRDAQQRVDTANLLSGACRGPIFVQPTLSYTPNPGQITALSGATALTLQSTVLS